MADFEAKQYCPSGVAPSAGVAAMVVAGAAVAFALAWVYGYAMLYNPFIYIGIIATVGFGFAIGMAVVYGGRRGKVRNRSVAIATGAVGGLVGLYCAWAVWLLAFAGRAGVSVELFTFFSPALMWDAILGVNEHGAWSIGRSGEAVTGILLWCVWAVEAGLVVGMAGWVAGTTLTSLPFCEDCDRWAEEKKDAMLLDVAAEDAVVTALRSGDVSGMVAARVVGSGSRDSLHVDLAVCPACSKHAYLTLRRVTITADKKGKEQTSSVTLIEQLMIPFSAFESMRQPKAAGQAPAAPEPK